jgi:hypothetical protein
MPMIGRKSTDAWDDMGDSSDGCHVLVRRSEC